jgi:hypothetical protein
MRGRPARVLLRQSAPLIAVAALLVVAPVADAGSPQPDQAPSSPATLAPDPVPGTVAPGASSPARSRVSAPASSTPVHVVSAAPAKPATRKTVKHTSVVPSHRPAPVRPSRYVLPRVAFPALIAAGPVRAPRDRDAILAGLALLLAAVTAGSGARLMAVWNRRARAA